MLWLWFTMGKSFSFVFGGPLLRRIFIMHKVCVVMFWLMKNMDENMFKWMKKIAPIHYVGS